MDYITVYDHVKKKQRKSRISSFFDNEKVIQDHYIIEKRICGQDVYYVVWYSYKSRGGTFESYVNIKNHNNINVMSNDGKVEYLHYDTYDDVK